jgi:hypothetical protein
MAIFGNNLVGPLGINVGPSFPFHLLCFLFSCSFRIAFEVQQIGRLTRALIFSKAKGGVNEEKVKRLT